MNRPKVSYHDAPDLPSSVVREDTIEYGFIGTLQKLKYEYWKDITNNARHFAFNADERFLPVYEYADEENRKITHLEEFADAFLKKCDLGRTISRYMVLIASEQKLMIMRPYQVYAVKHMVTCIDDDNGNGYIWHTTSSGKTLTSFKAATLLKENEHIHKCVFVVDRTSALPGQLFYSTQIPVSLWGLGSSKAPPPIQPILSLR